MSFWLPAAGLLLVSLLLMWGALRARKSDDAGSDEAEIARLFYRQQLDELSAEYEAKKLDQAAFDAAKSELDREFLRQSKEAHTPSKAIAVGTIAKGATLAVTAIIAIVVYVYLGNPNLQNAPLSDRIAAGENLNIEQAVVRIESHLRDNPDDVQGWRVVAPIYMRQAEFGKAVEAFRKIVELESETADNLTDLAEAQLSRDEGNASSATIELLRRAGGLDPAHIRSRFYLAA